MKIAFVLAAGDYGPMIVNHLDHDPGRQYGVGFEILRDGWHQAHGASGFIRLLEFRRQHYGDGVVALDCGASIGTHTVLWARAMAGWGEVLAFEPQLFSYYALCGNIALNNCFNALAYPTALGESAGVICFPQPDPRKAQNFGGLGRAAAGPGIACITIDSLALERCDLIKIDVEGMELEVLAGARETIERCQPMLLVEQIKIDGRRLRDQLSAGGHVLFDLGMDILALHRADHCLQYVSAPQAAA